MTNTGQARTDQFSEFVRNREKEATLSARIKRKALKIMPESVRKALDPDPEEKLEKAIEAFAAKNPSAFFVQIGACDGRDGDLLRVHIRNHGWRGIAVEPVPENYARLVETYKDYPTVTPRNVAIGSINGTAPFYSVAQPEGVELPEWTRQIGSFDRDHITKHAALHPGLEDLIVQIEVDTQTFDALLEQTGESGIDFLQTDVEGYDYEILKQIDFDRWKPRMVLYEDFHISAEDRAAASAMMEKAGYDLLQGGMNVLAIRRGA
jgi:FkbM family methyltransferase